VIFYSTSSFFFTISSIFYRTMTLFVGRTALRARNAVFFGMILAIYNNLQCRFIVRGFLGGSDSGFCGLVDPTAWGSVCSAGLLCCASWESLTPLLFASGLVPIPRIRSLSILSIMSFPFTTHHSPIPIHQSPITHHQSSLTHRQSPLTHHQSPIRNPKSTMTNDQSPTRSTGNSPRKFQNSLKNLPLSITIFSKAKGNL